MATALILGCTGQVGSQILSILRTGSSHFSTIETIARRPPPAASDSVIPIKETVENDTSKWGLYISSMSPPPSVMFYALASTRSAAGGFANQYKMEHEMMNNTIDAAKKAGTKTCVLISAPGANPSSYFGYTRMKGEIEEHIKSLDFDHTIIIRPGVIVGNRAKPDLSETAFIKLANLLGSVHSSLRDPWAQDASTIAKAAISAAIQVERGEVKDKIWILGTNDIVRLGKKEYNPAT